ncbi:hypothetical protein AOC36_01420 [Erysipelothrix larvae]|uniref:Sugar kinase n=1 Tax=Erysipelothrix larvae TaxID=1514105 RepID=A0A0X8GYD9_9FIRM|nr:ROK family protein [Erysipelothrix larvae]AMC92693.1 hypothetical protein AOC36_01420 [Erysipelothrix larvae]
MNVLVYDIGGTHIKYALINEAHQILEKGSVDTPKKSKEKFVECVKEIYESFDDIAGIAVSMPGRIDNIRGYAYTSGALLYLDETNMVELFHSFCDVFVAFDNDGKCAANAEAKLGSLQGIDDAIVLVFGTGIGGGIIKNRAVHRGHHFSAGEFSFMGSGSGSEGHYFGMDGSVHKMLRIYARLKNLEPDLVDGHLFFDAYEAQEMEARQAMDQYCSGVVPYIFNLQFVYDPEVIAIGGGISSRHVFVEALQHHVDAYYEAIPFKLAKPRLIQAAFRNDANLFGALMNYEENKQ